MNQKAQPRPTQGLFPKSLTAMECARFIVARFEAAQAAAAQSECRGPTPKGLSRWLDLEIPKRDNYERRRFTWERVQMELAQDLQAYANALPAEMSFEESGE